MKRKIITTSIVLIITITASVSILLLNFQHWNREEITIKLSDSEMLTYPGQKCWLLAEVKSNLFYDAYSTQISVEVNQSIDYDYTIWSLLDTKIVEIFLYPNITHLNTNTRVSLGVSVDTFQTQVSVIVSCINWTQNLPSEVIEIKNYFVNYFIDNISSFNVEENNSLEFMGNAPQVLVVEHYLFRTDFWEIEIARHVMIAPYDWVTAYIRPRNTYQPNWAGKIFSWSSGNHTILEIEPPENVFR